MGYRIRANVKTHYLAVQNPQHKLFESPGNIEEACGLCVSAFRELRDG